MPLFWCLAVDANQHSIEPPSIYYARGKFVARSISMMDVVMLAIGAVFFALSIGYVYACDQL
jgi:hypothetical protein